MKKITAIILSILFLTFTVLCASVHSSAYESADGLWTYSLNSGKAAVTGYHGTSSKVTIPATIDGYNVELGSYISISAKTVKLSEGIAVIGDLACYNNVVETVELPSQEEIDAVAAVPKPTKKK